MRSGLEVLFDDVSRLSGLRVGVCCNHTAVDSNLDHLLDRLAAAGIPVRRVFAPEHGLHATAQDMISVAGEDDGPAVVSLYGDTAASLRPDPALLADLDIVLFDIQDIGARYYTYQATLGYLMEVAATTGTRILVLDRPNPIDGVTIEGNLVRGGFESFVSAYPLPVRHGLTMGELALYFRDVLGIAAGVDVVPCEGWDPTQRFDATGLPWVYPSPNMPTLETAVLYPGMCLIEGTNLSEGRGTTRPFHLVGAPWLDAAAFTRLCRQGALDNDLAGVAFRAATFEPRFQKFAGKVCHGVEITVTNADRLESFLLGLVVIEAALRAAPDHFQWRTETYEFVDTPIAIDLLCGSAEARVGLMSKVRPRDLLTGWKGELTAWEEARAGVLLYPRE
ncbi:MAG: DUF1343 domain-containing protein [Pseudomonadota bacterium]|nr:DUF1343 domain-containing protein [Pseudomonadota bacterium]